MKRKSEGFVILSQKDGFWIAKANDKEVRIPSDACIMRNGIRQHPRLEAINEVVKLVGWENWTLFNV